MASTTLNTFMLPQPPFSVRSVEIKGSWDNFARSYRLRKDGHTGYWRGCHSFDNIVCDGITKESLPMRDGGLKMGGIYWYFYVLDTIDGELEYTNPDEPSTQACPLLPGQTVNLLEVPAQTNLVAGRNVSSASLDSRVFTLDPNDKYRSVHVHLAATDSAIKKHKSSLGITLNEVGSTTTHPRTPTSMQADESRPERPRSISSIFQKMRQTRSAGSNSTTALGWPRKLFSRGGKSVKPNSADGVPEVPKLPALFKPAPTVLPSSSEKDFMSPAQRPITAHGLRQKRESQELLPTPVPTSVNAAVVPWPESDRLLGQFCSNSASGENPGLDPPAVSTNSRAVEPMAAKPRTSHNGYTGRVPDPAKAIMMTQKDLLSNEPRVGLQEEASGYSTVGNHGSRSSSRRHHIDVPHAPQQVEDQRSSKRSSFALPDRSSAAFSYTASDDFSPYCTSNETRSESMSPLHLSQPETPNMSEFGEDLTYLRRESEDARQLSLDFSNSSWLADTTAPSRVPPPPPLPVLSPKPATNQPIFGVFQGYRLPEDDNASMTTIRKPPSTHLTTSAKASPLNQQNPTQNSVNSWNDGSEHLLEDLGYLGEMIN